MTRRSVVHQAILPAVALFLFVPLLAWTPSASADIDFSDPGFMVYVTTDNTATTAKVKALHDAALTSWFGADGEPSNLTAAKPIWFEVTYAAVPTLGNPDISPGVAATVWYTTDGTPPRKPGPNFTLDLEDSSGATTLYRGSLPVDEMTTGHAIRFMVEIADQTQEATACDFGKAPPGQPRISQSECPAVAPSGAGYRFLIDRTRPVLEVSSLTPSWTTDVWRRGVAATANESFGLSLNVTDSDVNSASAFNARINESSLRVTVTFHKVGVSDITTVLFDNTTTPSAGGKVGNRLNLTYTADGYRAAFRWNTTQDVPRFGHTFFPAGNASVWWNENGTGGTPIHQKWGPNFNYTINVNVLDWAGNSLLTAADQRRFQVDQLEPSMDLDLIATRAVPSQVEEDSRGNVFTVVGLGTQVHVQLNATDWTMNISRANTSAVRVHLENTSTGIRTPSAPLIFNATTTEGKKTNDNVSITPVHQYKGLLNITNMFNISAPGTVLTPTQNLSLRYSFTLVDTAGNSHTQVSQSVFVLKPGLPVVTVTEPPGAVVAGTRFVAAGPYNVVALATDQPEGVTSVKLTIRNETGKFLDLSGWTRIGTNTFERTMDRVGATNNYTKTIPAADNQTTVLYNVSAQDAVGNFGRSADLRFRVDTQAPTLGETSPTDWRNGMPHNITFGVLDAGSGPNATSGFINYRVGTSGGFTNKSMNFSAGSGGSGLFNAVLTGTVSHLDTVQYHAAASDAVGNWVSNGTGAAPRSYRVDLVKPVASLNATPASSDTGKFRLSGLGTDADSGVKSFLFEGQFRSPGAATFSGWIPLGQDFTLTRANVSRSFTTDELCLIGGGVTYQFRAVAIDDAGNRGDPSAAQTTEVPGLGCEGDLVITISQPSPGSLVDAEGGTGTKLIQYRATATGSFVSDALILIKIEFSPDNGATYVTLAQNLPNTGNYTWTVNAPTCSQCKLKITGTLPDGTVEVKESDAFEVIGGNRLVDFDGNGLGDSCELAAFGELGVADPRADPDNDDLTTEQECAFGTDPMDADSDDDGTTDGVEIQLKTNPLDRDSKPSAQAVRYTQWGDFVWIVPVLFALVTIVFLVGLARRW